MPRQLTLDEVDEIGFGMKKVINWVGT